MQIRKPEPPESRGLTGHSETLLSEMYHRILLIRRFELTVAAKDGHWPKAA